MEVGGGTIDVLLPETAPNGLGTDRLLEWVQASARAVTAYFGRFPVAAVRLRVQAGSGRTIGSGVTFGGPSPHIRIRVGASATDSDLRDDWVLTHEMTHLAFPDLTSDDTWAEEGLATYVEPLARIRVGTHTEDEMWGELLDGLPKGLAH